MSGNDYPEHEKMAEIVDVSNRIGEFLEWLHEQTDYRVCERHERGKNLFGDPIVEYFPLNRPFIRDLLARYYSIDLQKIEQEKRQMLVGLRKMQEQANE